MALPLDEHLQVDNIDSFLILRSLNTAYSSGYAIYGIWFFPEDDRSKILQLLQRLIQSLKAPHITRTENSTPTMAQMPIQMLNKKQLTQQEQQERLPSQSRNRSRSRNKRDDSKRSSSTINNPITILQRSSKDKRSDSSSSGSSGNGSAKQENTPALGNSIGMVPVSKADGVAAGEAIMGMISQNPSQPHKQQPSSRVSKEQLKQALIGLLDDAQFFDQIYLAYVSRAFNRE